MVTPTEGERAVQLAREALEHTLVSASSADPAAQFRGRVLPSLFDEARGVFVTLKHYPNDELRGCIGYPVPVYPLRAAIPRVAVAAAREDPRFPSVEPRELAHLTVEVTLLSLPEVVSASDPLERPSMIQVGRDGLIVETEETSGLLLPQVADEQGWDAETFLSATCEKAGLSSDAWRSDQVTVRRFTGDRFRELHPPGMSARGGAPVPE